MRSLDKPASVFWHITPEFAVAEVFDGRGAGVVGARLESPYPPRTRTNAGRWAHAETVALALAQKYELESWRVFHDEAETEVADL